MAKINFARPLTEKTSQIFQLSNPGQLSKIIRGEQAGLPLKVIHWLFVASQSRMVVRKLLLGQCSKSMGNAILGVSELRNPRTD